MGEDTLLIELTKLFAAQVPVPPTPEGRSVMVMAPQLGAADTALVPVWVRNCLVEDVFPGSFVQAGVELP